MVSTIDHTYFYNLCKQDITDVTKLVINTFYNKVLIVLNILQLQV